MMASNEVQRYDGDGGGTVARSALDSWAGIFGQVVTLAEHVCHTEFVPKALRGNAPATAAAMLYGRELGVGPMRAMQTVHVVDGRPTLAAEQMRAMVLAAGHEFEYREHSRAKCIVAGRRAGTTSYTVVEWTMQDARDQGLAGKPNWRRLPRQMLVARATGELCRMIFADVIGGAYSTEEISDGADDDGPVDGPRAVEPRQRRKTVQRKTAVRDTSAPPRQLRAVDEPAPAGRIGPPLPHENDHHGDSRQDDGQDDEHDAEQDGGEPIDVEFVDEHPAGSGAQGALPLPDGPINDAQLRKLHTVFTKHDLTDREECLHIARVITGRADLNSSKNLTRSQASLVLDTFARLEREAGDEFRSALAELVAEWEAYDRDHPGDAEQTDHDDGHDDGGTNDDDGTNGDTGNTDTGQETTT